jgi:hypothetical protein
VEEEKIGIKRTPTKRKAEAGAVEKERTGIKRTARMGMMTESERRRKREGSGEREKVGRNTQKKLKPMRNGDSVREAWVMGEDGVGFSFFLSSWSFLVSFPSLQRQLQQPQTTPARRMRRRQWWVDGFGWIWVGGWVGVGGCGWV